MDLEQLVCRLTTAILAELQPEAQQTIQLFCRRDRGLPPGLGDQLASDVRLRYFEEIAQPGKVDRYLLPCLHIDAMVDLAHGKGGSRMTQAVRQVLLSGQKVEVCQWEYRNYLDTAPRQLLALYDGYRRTLHGFGLIDWIATHHPRLHHGKTVLTEADIVKAKEQGAITLEISASCRITPLARETARHLGIALLTETGGTA